MGKYRDCWDSVMSGKMKLRQVFSFLYWRAKSALFCVNLNHRCWLLQGVSSLPRFHKKKIIICNF